MKKRNITVIRNCLVYLNKNDIIEEWLEPGSMKSVGMKVMSEVAMLDVFGYYKNEYGFLYEDELRAEVVEDIFSACFWSVPVDRICQRLNAMSCVTPDGYDEWTPELIEMIIHNEIYAGYKFIEEDGKVILYKHDNPIVTKVMYAAVQKIGITKNDAPQEERISKVTNILAKVIAQRGQNWRGFLIIMPYNAKLY